MLARNAQIAKATDSAFEADRVASFNDSAGVSEVQRYVFHSPSFDGINDPRHAEFAGMVFQSVFADREVSLDDTFGERLLLAWRIIRELGRHLDLFEPGNMLTEALQPDHYNVDPWTIPYGLPDPAPGTSNAKQITSNGCPRLIGKIQQAFTHRELANRRHHVYAGDDINGEPTRIEGLPLLPPRREPGDPLLDLYKESIAEIASHLGLRDGTPENPEMARHALPQILEDPVLAVPPRTQIAMFEELLVDEALEFVVDKSPRQLKAEFFRRFGLLPHETRGVLGMARWAAMRDFECDLEESRAMMVMRLDRVAERAQETYDIRAELGALKQVSIIQGLANVESGDLNSDFAEVVKSVASKPKNPALPNGAKP